MKHCIFTSFGLTLNPKIYNIEYNNRFIIYNIIKSKKMCTNSMNTMFALRANTFTLLMKRPIIAYNYYTAYIKWRVI